MLLAVFISIHPAWGSTEYFVATSGSDANAGTSAAPFRTIQHAADTAQPGDTITVHTGVYREEINPPRGGLSDTQRITYQAAPGEKVEIKGSEQIKNWQKVQDDTWKVVLPNKFFGNFNPYSDLIHGDWYKTEKLKRHTGTVYLNGDWLSEARSLNDVLKPVGGESYWFAQVDANSTTIWAQFKGVDPNAQQVEINVRQSVFYPRKTGMNYLTLRGFKMDDAATPWAPPDARQIGLIGTNWSKGWIIENNDVSYSMCSGISLGKYDDPEDHPETNNRVSGQPVGAALMVAYINRAASHGWNKEAVGGHLVRNNTVSHCEQAGINGSLGPVFSVITGNLIHDIHVKHWFDGPEIAGIKFHSAIDVVISGNHIYRSVRGIWLDWMAQGAHVVGNLLHDNSGQDLFVEVDHGPFLVANNIMLSRQAVLINSDGGAFVHNLIGGGVKIMTHESRSTEFMKAHSTEIAGLHKVPPGDLRFYNNIFAAHDSMEPGASTTLPSKFANNVYLAGSTPPTTESSPLVESNFNPAIQLEEKPDGYYLEMTFDKAWSARTRNLVTTELLGVATIPNLPFENADGTPIRVDTDYLGAKRGNNPFPGPFEIEAGGKQEIKVWPNPAMVPSK